MVVVVYPCVWIEASMKRNEVLESQSYEGGFCVAGWVRLWAFFL